MTPTLALKSFRVTEKLPMSDRPQFVAVADARIQTSATN